MRLLRATVRRFTQDDFARELTSDFQEDRQLKAALLLMSERVGLKVEEIAQLKFLKETFPEGIARTRKPKPAEGEKDEKDEKGRDFK